MERNIVRHNFKVTMQKRNDANKHRSFVVWFTGLSGSGKSTMADSVEQVLFEKGIKTFILDGDNIRNGINKDLKFTPADRTENLRRIAEIAKLMVDAGVVVLAAFISPTNSDRYLVKEIIGSEHYVEVFVNTKLEVCEERDVKGLYAKARSGLIGDFTGISSPYEKPANADIELLEQYSIEESASLVCEYINKKLSL